MHTCGNTLHFKSLKAALRRVELLGKPVPLDVRIGVLNGTIIVSVAASRSKDERESGIEIPERELASDRGAVRFFSHWFSRKRKRSDNDDGEGSEDDEISNVDRGTAWPAPRSVPCGSESRSSTCRCASARLHACD